MIEGRNENDGRETLPEVVYSRDVDAGPLDVVAVGAHPDDVEIACGGKTVTGGSNPTLSAGNCRIALFRRDGREVEGA